MTVAEPITTTVLTESLIDRCGERAAGYDRENRFFCEDFEELQAGRLPADGRPEGARRPRAVAGRGLPASSAAWPTARRPRRWPPTCTSTGWASPPTCAGWATRRCTWMLRGGRRGRGLRGRPRRGRQRPAGAALDGQGRARGRRLPLHRPQDVRQPDAGLDPPRHPRAWTPRDPSTRRSSTPSCRATPRATRSRRPGTRSACAPPAATTRSWTAPSSRTSTSARIVPAGGARPVRRRALRLGAAELRQHLLRPRAAGARPGRGVGAQEDLAGRLALDGLPPGGPARGGRDDAGDRRRRAAPRPRRRRTGPTASTTAASGRRRSSRPSTTPSRRPSGSWTWRWTSPAAAGMFKRNELERLYRDVRCGGFHPANSALVHEIVGKTTLGIDLGEQPRWG